MMEILVRDGGETTIYRGSWGGRKGATPLLDFFPGWGLALSVEFPSEWHEHQFVILSLCLIWGRLWVYIPWFRRYADHDQCSGPKFGFSLTNMGNPDFLTLFLYYGNDDGTPRGSRVKVIYGPWAWGRSVRWDKSPDKETHDFTYTLRSGEVQRRKATIQAQEQEWRRWWLPWRKIWRGIDVQFDDEVGERSGTWKGGVVGCGYEMRDGETPLECLRRMERERRL